MAAERSEMGPKKGRKEEGEGEREGSNMYCRSRVLRDG